MGKLKMVFTTAAVSVAALTVLSAGAMATVAPHGIMTATSETHKNKFTYGDLM